MMRAIGALIRGLWWLLLSMWTMPVPRVLLAALVVWWGWPLWWTAVVSWGAPLVRWWPWVAAAVAALLVAAIAGGIHHVAPMAYRQIAVGRAVAYWIALLPAALAAGAWVGGLGSSTGHVLGIVAWIVVAAVLGAHLRYGPELRT